MDSFNITTEATTIAQNAHTFFTSVLKKMENLPIPKISFLFGFSIVVGSIIPYIPQYWTIHKTQNTEGFSLYVCLTLLVANILRIIFWFGHKYETPLLIQAIVMIATMFALLELCVRVRGNNIRSRRKNYFTDSKQCQESEINSVRNSALNINFNNEKLQVKFSDSSKSTMLPSPTILDNCEANSNQISPETILSVPSLPVTPIASLDASNGKNYSTISSPSEPEPIPVHTFKNNQTQCENKSDSNDCYTSKAPSEDSSKADVLLLEQEMNNNNNDDDDIHKNEDDNDNKLVINVNEDELIEIDFGLQENAKICNVSSDLPEKRHFMDFNWRYFWEWTDFISYIECTIVFTFVASSIMFLFDHNEYVVEGIGYTALITESLLASPQLYRNFKSKSTEGMSQIMVAAWFGGDLYKTVYYILSSTPVQFILCGLIQITLDLLVFMQLYIYRKSSYKKLSKTRAHVAVKEERNLLPDQDESDMRKNSRISHSQSQSPILDDGSAEEDVELKNVSTNTKTSNAFINSDFDIVTEFRMQSDSSGDD